MKTIIAGSRGIVNYTDLIIAMHGVNWKITEIVSGTAKGVDQLGEQYAEEHKINLIRFPAQWWKYGKSAGIRRNDQMAAYADAALILWDGKSKGTKDMIETSHIFELQIYIHLVK